MNEIEQTLRHAGSGSTGELSACVNSHRAPATARQGGGIAIMFGAVLVVILGFCGFALELSQIYNRKVEMKNIADAIALAAARNLDGSPAGITKALAAASQTAALYSYGYGKIPLSWSDAAISFSTTPAANGSWVDAGTASGTAAQMFYVRVDTSGLSGSPGSVQMSLIQVVSPLVETVEMDAIAIAGRSALDVTPLAICAMSPTPAASRANAGGFTEVVEYGFRRGVSYDLMRLSPIATTPPTPLHYVVNPIAPAGASGAANDTDVSTVGPYVCAGTLGSPRLMGGEVLVTSSFPIGSLYQQLNSRFDQYSGNLCDFNGAPPDRNIKQYTYTSIPWVTITSLAHQMAEESNAGNKVMTIADLAPPGGSAAQYGPVWAYAKAAQYAATEPAAGYTAFGATVASWNALYNGQSPNGYPAGSSTPYKATTGANFSAPNAAHRPVADRRVLNVPLLSCPVPAGTNVTATVLATAKFFMTVPATSTSIYAEFAGAVPLAKVTGDVELF
jgi:Flp pilus assembly protein TadG